MPRPWCGRTATRSWPEGRTRISSSWRTCGSGWSASPFHSSFSDWENRGERAPLPSMAPHRPPGEVLLSIEGAGGAGARIAGTGGRRSAPSHGSERGPWRAPRHADPRLDPDAYAELGLRRVLDTQERGLLDLFGRHLADDADGDGRADPERHAHDRRERP